MMAHDAELTRAKLLAAAHEEFITHGIAGSRVARIADTAGVNKERIYAYFGNKEKLFQAVLTDAMDEMVALAKPGVDDGDMPGFVGRVMDLHRANPCFLRLLMWEALHYGAEPQGMLRRRQEWYARQVEQLARATGRPVEEAARQLFVLIGIGAWPTALLSPPLFGAEHDDMLLWQQRLRASVVDFVARALKEG
ncbi:TetR/AcrR family transcriptional regulator [Streptomyces sp. NPDC055254]